MLDEQGCWAKKKKKKKQQFELCIAQQGLTLGVSCSKQCKKGRIFVRWISRSRATIYQTNTDINSLQLCFSLKLRLSQTWERCEIEELLDSKRERWEDAAGSVEDRRETKGFRVSKAWRIPNDSGSDHPVRPWLRNTNQFICHLLLVAS